MDTRTLNIETKNQNNLAFTALAFAMVEDDKIAERIRLKMRVRYEAMQKTKEVA